MKWTKLEKCKHNTAETFLLSKGGWCWVSFWGLRCDPLESSAWIGVSVCEPEALGHDALVWPGKFMLMLQLRVNTCCFSKSLRSVELVALTQEKLKHTLHGWQPFVHVASHPSRLGELSTSWHNSSTRGHLESCASFLLNFSPSPLAYFTLYLLAVVRHGSDYK